MEQTALQVTNDVERQLVLQIAGWRFLRLRYSDWCDEQFVRSELVKRVKAALGSDGK